MSVLRVIHGAVILVVVLLAGCSAERGAGTSLAPGTKDGTTPKVVAYPPGPWRLASREQLSQVVVWVSQIQIAYGGPGVEASARSRDQAYARAVSVRDEARRAPERFEALAKQYSDDSRSRERGGSLGGVRAERLPSAFVDALEPLSPGEVSDVFETPAGFHVLLRRSPPPEEKVSGYHVSIAYGGTEDGARTRDDAKALATALVARARNGQSIESLATQYSDEADRARGGLLGTWSVRAPDVSNGAVLEELARLAFGQISDPIDLGSRFEVLQRTDRMFEREFAARVLRIPMGSVAGLPEATLDLARRTLESIQRNSGDFAAQSQRFCCKEPQKWREGHGEPALLAALETTDVGAFVQSPIRIGTDYVLAQRLDPQLVATPMDPQTQFPGHLHVDVETLVRNNESQYLCQAIDQLRPAIASLKLPTEEMTLLDSGLAELKSGLTGASDGEARVRVYWSHMERLHSGLSPASYSRLTNGIDSWVSARIFDAARQQIESRNL